jgi:hypothetical protein
VSTLRFLGGAELRALGFKGVAQISTPAAASYEILRTDCTGRVIFMDGSAYEMAAELPVAAETMELLHTMMNARGAEVCETWSDDEYSERCLPILCAPSSARSRTR